MGSAIGLSGRIRSLVGLALAVVLLLGCSDSTEDETSDQPETTSDRDETTSDRDTPVPPLDTRALLATTWRMRFGGGPDGEVMAVDGSPITITFEGDGSFRGLAGCNEYSGLFVLTDTQLQLNGILRTAMACTDDGVMEAESAYLAALADVSEVDLGEGQLIMAGFSTELIFVGEPEP